MAEGKETFEHVGELRFGVGFAHVGKVAVLVEVEAVVTFNRHAIPVAKGILDFAVLTQHIVAVMQFVTGTAVASTFAAEIQREFEADAYGPLVGDFVEGETGVRGRSVFLVFFAGLDVFVGHEFLTNVEAHLEVYIPKDFCNAVFKSARCEGGLYVIGILFGVSAKFVVEREELESETAQDAQVEISDQIECETTDNRGGVHQERKSFIVERARGIFFPFGLVVEMVFRTVFDGAELNRVDFDTQPQGERNVCLPCGGD